MCYIPYCSNQLTAKTLKSLLSKTDVKQFLQEAYQNPLLGHFDLPAFLLKPVQRICKYPLLIREMIKHTAVEAPEIVLLNKALERIQMAVGTINECSKRNGIKTVLDVQARFSEVIYYNECRKSIL